MAQKKPDEEEKKQLPPIEEVACSEAVFTTDRMMPAWEKIREENKLEPNKEKEGAKPSPDDVPRWTLTKAQVQKWWETSLQREPFDEAGVTGPAFTPLYNLIPKIEEGKEEVEKADA